MKLYWCPRTRSARAVWMLEETGVEYQRVLVDIADPRAKKDPAVRAASPMGKVPALEDGELRMSESAAICLYLADRYASGRLAPPIDHPTRGRFLYWMFYTPAVIEPAMSEKAGGWEPHPGRNGWGSFDLMIETLERGLGDGPWIMGGTFTAADVMLGSSCVFARRFGMLPDSEVLNAYADRCLARPAYRKAMEAESAPPDGG